MKPEKKGTVDQVTRGLATVIKGESDPERWSVVSEELVTRVGIQGAVL